MYGIIKYKPSEDFSKYIIQYCTIYLLFSVVFMGFLHNTREA